tara:strand:- start:1161 stop:1493 length:333 start_codon:yes stop_codon:yes gene_type:complete
MQPDEAVMARVSQKIKAGLGDLGVRVSWTPLRPPVKEDASVSGVMHLRVELEEPRSSELFWVCPAVVYHEEVALMDPAGVKATLHGRLVVGALRLIELVLADTAPAEGEE